MADIPVIKQCLEEYRQKKLLSDILWVRNIIVAIGLEEFDSLLKEAWIEDKPK
jgi:hypothetical protein